MRRPSYLRAFIEGLRVEVAVSLRATRTDLCETTVLCPGPRTQAPRRVGEALGSGAYRIAGATQRNDNVEAGGELTGREAGWRSLLPMVAVLVATGPLLLWGFGEYYSAGLVTPLILILALALAASSRLKLSDRGRRLYWCFLGCALSAVLLQMAISRPVWETIPLMPLFQFPWRMMGSLALFTSVLAGMLFLGLAGGLSRRSVLLLELLVLALCIANGLPQLARIRSFSPEAVASIEQGMTAEAIRSGRQSATGVDEYLPAGADLAAWKETPPGALLLNPPTNLRVLAAKEEGTRTRLNLEAPNAMQLGLARWYFPEWRVSSNGEPVPVLSGTVGEVLMGIPRGRSHLEVDLEPPLERRVGVWISSIAVVVFLLALGAHLLPWFGPTSTSWPF